MHNSQPTDFTKLDDPSFLAERARLRGLLEDPANGDHPSEGDHRANDDHLANEDRPGEDDRPANEDNPDSRASLDELQQRYDAMTAEFCRRARIAWTRTS